MWRDVAPLARHATDDYMTPMSAAQPLAAMPPLDGVDVGARVVVAMSGGVDSTVAAALTATAGYETVGVTLQLYDHGAASRRVGACCAGEDIHDARSAAAKLGISHYVLDYESRFADEVIAPFVDSYLAGRSEER